MRLSAPITSGALVALLLAGCVVGPLPEPPQVELDADKVLTTDPSHRGPGLWGQPEAASPAGAVVRLYPLDSAQAPLEAVVEDDGSFTFNLSPATGDELRLQVIAEAGRSRPVDLVVAGSGDDRHLRPATRPLGSCFLLDPEAALDLDQGRTITIDNRCAEELRIDEPALRRPIDGLVVGGAHSWPLRLAPGDSLTVELEPSAELDQEEILFIRASAPEVDRRPITVMPP
jgi:hypothetical protein